MLQEILSKLTPEITSGLQKQFGLGQNQTQEVMSTTKDSLLGTLGKTAASGNLDGVLGLLNQKGSFTDNPVFKSMAENLIGSYVSKIGLSKEKSSSIVSYVLPLIIKTMSGAKSGDFNKADLLKLLGSSLGGSITDKAGDLLKGGLGNLFK